jgi:hypothetical protein
VRLGGADIGVRQLQHVLAVREFLKGRSSGHLYQGWGLGFIPILCGGKTPCYK